MSKSKKGSYSPSKPNESSQNLEATLWAAADKLWPSIDAAEYKHVVLGLIFLKYISDAFEEKRASLDVELSDSKSPYYVKDIKARYEAVEDVDEYRAANIFYVPKNARWSYLQSRAKLSSNGKDIDDAMDLIEKENPSLAGVLPKDYARPALDSHRLGELIDLIGTIGLGNKSARSQDILGRVYEYFLGQFADAEGKRGGQFYTPQSIVKLLVAMLEPYKGRVFDPCCGSGGMFVQSERFIEAHGGKIGDISVFGQESNRTTWRLAKMNLAIRGIDAKIEWGDSFHEDKHKDLKVDYLLANPPFNVTDWRGNLLTNDARWKFGTPPTGNANFAWVQHFISHLAPHGMAGFVLANGSLSSNSSGEGEIRKSIVEADLVDCMVSLPGQLFYNTQIPVCLWFITRDKKNHHFRDRRGETLFIDATQLGSMIDRKHLIFTDDDINKIAYAYHSWRNKNGVYSDIPGFCQASNLENIRKQGHILTPGRYIRAKDNNVVGDSFENEMHHLTKTLKSQFARHSELSEVVRQKLRSIGFEV